MKSKIWSLETIGCQLINICILKKYKIMLYEQPLNEQIRLCLRLEYLFEQANYFLSKESIWDTHQTLKIILEILQVIDRPDIKNKFFQTMNHYVHVLTQLEKVANVDKDKLTHTLKLLEHLIDFLHASQKKFGQDLRENEFLNAIQQRLYTPGGTCGFSIPTYHLWLQQDSNTRIQQLHTWFNNFAKLREIVVIILKLLRESTIFKPGKAEGGFYQCNLEPSIAYQLIRIKTISLQNIFPEVSSGRYRLTIHFFTLHGAGNSTQTSENINFELACCRM